MNIVVLSTGRAPTAPAVAGVRRQFAGLPAARLSLVTWLTPSEPLDRIADMVVVLGPSPSAATGPIVRSRVVRALRRLVKGGVSRQFWTQLRRRDDAVRVVAEARAVIALDTGAARAGWHLARRHPSAVVTIGVPAAVRQLESDPAEAFS